MVAKNPVIAPILWRRLDLPGSERAQLDKSDNGWVLSGIVDVTYGERQWRIEYRVECKEDWRTERASIVARNNGNERRIVLESASPRAWNVFEAARMDERTDLAECIDVDFGFSPSTNLLPIRRLDLAIGAGADVTATWVKFPELTVHRLDQRYTRLAERTYLYESGKDFRRELTVNESGLVVDYPGLWRAEDSPTV